MAEHFVQSPNWEWPIVGYFFIVGLAGGSYVLATMLRIWGSKHDEEIARSAFLFAFPLAVLCGILLTIDLGQPLRFWHMMINTTPNNGGFNFKYWSPMSLGVWALLIFNLFAFVSFVGAFVAKGAPTRIRLVFNAIGSIVALFLCSYTGVLLSVSNQPIWSDSWAIGGLFLASALSSSAALLSWLSWRRSRGAPTEVRLWEADRYFAALEFVLIVIFFVTLGIAGTLSKTLSGLWLVLWILVIASLVPSLAGLTGRRIQIGSRGGSAAMRISESSGALMALVVILGVLLIRIVVIFSAQF